jgi:integrase
MVAGGRHDLAGKRDRALLLLGFALAARRSELVALDVADLEDCPEGFRITIRRSKTDQEGAGAKVAVCRGSIACPVAAVKEWLAAAGIIEGPVFRPVGKGGRLRPGRLSPQMVALIVNAYAARLGLDPGAFSGHSLRSGFLTSAAATGRSGSNSMTVRCRAPVPITPPQRLMFRLTSMSSSGSGGLASVRTRAPF